MKTISRRVCIGFLAVLPCQALLAQRKSDGGANNAPPPAVFSVVWMNPDNLTVRLRASDGRTRDVIVPADVYDVSTLKAGDKIRVDFISPGPSHKGLKAAAIYPLN